jgi:hypothetical protein
MRLFKKQDSLKLSNRLIFGKNSTLRVNHENGTSGDANLGAIVARAQELTASGAVNPGVQRLTLNHATVAIAATVASAKTMSGYFTILDNSASGTAAHTVTLTGGTFDGTNNTATLNAPNEMLLVHMDGDGNGVVVVNTGSVALSSV